MADVRPTLDEIFARMRADAAAARPGVDVDLPRTLFGVQLVAFVGAIHEAWGHLDSIAVDVFADVATQSALERHAAIWGVFRDQFVKAFGTVNFGVLAAGPPVEIGRRLRRADGVEYITTSVPIQLVGLDWESDIEAVVAGGDGNYSGDLQLIEPVPGLTDLPAVVASGADGDDDDELRAEYLDVLRSPPQGGTAADFERWVLEVPALTRAWVQPPAAGSPDFDIYVADDSNEPPTPAGGDVVSAQAEADANAPVTANPTVLAATFDDLDAAITISPNTGDIQTAVDDEIVSMLLEFAAPGVTILLSWLQEAVARTPGLVDFTITSPVADVPVSGADDVMVKGTTVYS